MKKLTVRVPDDIADDFADFCALAGITQTAAIESAMRRTVELFTMNGRTVPDEWASDAPSTPVAYVTLARQLDAEKRRKT